MAVIKVEFSFYFNTAETKWMKKSMGSRTSMGSRYPRETLHRERYVNEKLAIIVIIYLYMYGRFRRTGGGRLDKPIRPRAYSQIQH
jgi:hypothetical protein